MICLACEKQVSFYTHTHSLSHTHSHSLSHTTLLLLPSHQYHPSGLLQLGKQQGDGFIAAKSSTRLFNEFIHLNCHNEVWTGAQSCSQSHFRYGSLLMELTIQIQETKPSSLHHNLQPSPVRGHSGPLQALEQVHEWIKPWRRRSV